MPAQRSRISRLAAVSALLIVAAGVAACGPLTRVAGPTEWVQEVGLQDGTKQTITVRDTSGRISQVAFDPPGVQDPGAIANPAGQPATVLVPWTGGACDVRTTIEFAAQGQGLKGTVAVETSGDMCIMMAVPHLLQLTTDGPMPAASVTLEAAPTR
jgi:hypothetical protein